MHMRVKNTMYCTCVGFKIGGIFKLIKPKSWEGGTEQEYFQNIHPRAKKKLLKVLE